MKKIKLEQDPKELELAEIDEVDYLDDFAQIDQVEQLFEQTKQKLIAHYGENKEELINGRKHIVINEYLNSFVKFFEAIRSAAKKFKFNLQEQIPALAAICNYCEDAEYADMQAAANSIKKKLNSSNIYSVRKFEQNFKAIFDEINGELDNQKFNKSKISSILAYNLDAKFLNLDYDYRTHKRVSLNYTLRSSF